MRTAVAPARSRQALAVGLLIAGCLALIARPPLLAAIDDPVVGLMMLFAGLLGVGLLYPITSSPSSATAPAWPTTLLVLAVGVGAFALGRTLGGGEAPFDLPAAALARLILLNSFAAVAEEAFFRRFAYGILVSRSGAVVAVAGSAALFAVVHVTVYGWWVLPLDLAAGLVLSWQRWASGSWRVPAITHVLANVLVVV